MQLRRGAVARRALLNRICHGVLIAALTSCAVVSGPAPEPFIRYTVQSGDTLYGISRRFGVTLEEIERLNEVGDPRALAIGAELKLPYRGQSLTGTGVERASLRPAAGGFPLSPSGATRTVSISAAARYIGKLAVPVEGARFTSKFGSRWLSFHEGIDLAADEGTPILAAHAGEVVYSGRGLNGYGNTVVIRGDGLMTVYAHNERNRVRVGERVDTGDHIADVGSTGRTSGPHCHFETRVRDAAGRYVAVDPWVFLRR